LLVGDAGTVNKKLELKLADMHFKASVLRGLEQARRGEGISHDEVKGRLATWLKSSGRVKLSRR
jgi:predicted transcriptional regulator